MRDTTGLIKLHNTVQEMISEVNIASWLIFVGGVVEMNKEKAMIIGQR